MKTTTQLFIEHLGRNNIRYSILNESYDYEEEKGDALRVVFDMDNIRGLEVTMLINNDDVSACAMSITKIPQGKKSIVLNKINDIHAQYRWLKFFVNEDDELSAQIDAIIIEKNNAAEICADVMLKILRLADLVYPEFMKIIW